MLELWPFTNFHDMNLDWIIKTIKTYTKKVDDFIEDINDTWNTFRNWVTNEIAEMHRKFAIYVNVTEGALNTGAIADGAITEPKIDDDFLKEIKNAYVTPEMLSSTGTDTDQLEYAINHTPEGGILCIDHLYTLDRNVTITKASSTKRITILGIGETAAIDTDNYFITGSVAHDTGNITWININFSGEKIFDSDYLIRQYCVNCIFDGIGSIIFSNAGTADAYAQTYYFINCVIRRATNYLVNLPADVYNTTTLFDIRFSHCLIEWCMSGIIKGNVFTGAYIENCTIEGFTTNDPLFTGMRTGMMFKVSDCYFEHNDTTYVDFSNFTVQNPFMFEFTGNTVQEFTECTVFLTGTVPGYGSSNFLITDNTFYTTQPHANDLVVIDATAATQQMTTWNVYNNQNHNNYATMLVDPNNRVKINESFNSTVTNLVRDYGSINKHTGESYTFYIHTTAVALSTTQLAIPVTFPFVANNTNYSITFNSIYVTNIGSLNVQNAAIGGSKYAAGFDLRYNDSDTVNFTANRPYIVRIGITITF